MAGEGGTGGRESTRQLFQHGQREEGKKYEESITLQNSYIRETGKASIMEGDLRKRLESFYLR